MSGAGEEEEGGGKSPRSRSPAMGVSGLLRDHQNKVCIQTRWFFVKLRDGSSHFFRFYGMY